MNEKTFPYVFGQNVGGEYPSVSFAIERITPAIAAKMLETNVSNRSMKREPLKKAILNGEWCMNGESISFSDRGILLDGQNRLAACVAAGIPIDILVVRGIPFSAQTTMDLGVKRQLADHLKMMGYPQATNLAAITVALQRAELFGLEGAFNKPNGSDVTVKSSISFVQRNYDTRLKRLITPTGLVKKHYKGIASGTIAALIEQFMNNVSDDDYKLFYDQLTEQKPPCQSVLVLNRRLKANAESKKGRLPQKVVAAYIIKAFNAYMTGCDLACLKFTQGGAHPESFPEIYKDGDAE